MSTRPQERTPEQDPPDEPIVHKTWVYRLGRFLVASYLCLFHRLRIEGAQHLPREGGALIVANHQSYLDIPAVAASTRRHVSFVARASLARSRFLAFVMRHSGVVLIQRGTADRAALRAMARHLELGDLVTVYPEGTRSPDGRLGEFRGGALLAARMAGVPIVPAGIRGTLEALHRDARRPALGRPVAVRFGPAIDAAAPDALERARQAISAMIGDGRFSSVPRQ